MIKKKIKNILKYILTYSTLGIITAITFFTCLCANTYATTNNNLINYRVEQSQNLNNVFINNDLEFNNQNISARVEDNIFRYYIFNIANYKNNMSYINDYVLTIPYSLSVGIPQSNNYEYNNYSIALYYLYTNDYNNITINNFTTFIESVSDSLNKETNTTNYYNDYINITIPQENNNTYLILGYYETINYDTSTTPLYSWVELYFAFDYSLINVFNGANETNESLKQQNQQLQNELSITNSQYNTLSDNYNDLVNNYDTLNTNYETLTYNYQTLNNQYNALATNQYTFENLFWSVGSVPMAFLLQSFNVNVLGMNIRAIITGLITALLIIWIIKKLLK